MQGLLEEVLRRGEVLEQGAPGADFCFAGALDEDVEVVREGGEEGQDGGEEGGFRGRGNVDFLVEDSVQEDFEGVGEVREVLVVVGEVEGGRGVVDGEVVAEERGEEELGLWWLVLCVMWNFGEV